MKKLKNMVVFLIFYKKERRREMLARNTYLEVNLKNLGKNIKTLLKIHPDYQYYFGVVKADCYGQGGSSRPIRTMIQVGLNYLAVATLDEALDMIEVEVPQKGDKKLVIHYPDVAEYGYELKYNGTDYEQVIGDDLTIYQPISDMNVKVSFKGIDTNKN